MNKLKKIGLTALAGSLVATSVFAGSLDVTGSAGVTFGGADKGVSGNGFSMGDEVTFAGSGEMDNGWNVTVSMQLDGSETATGNLDNRSVKIDTGEMGVITFAGHGGDSVVGGKDDVMPTAYGESFDVLAAGAGDTGTTAFNAIGSAGSDNMMRYDNSELADGVSFAVSYVPSGTGEVESSMDVGVEYTGFEGVTLGYARGEDNAAGVTGNTDNDTMYVKYVFGSVTVGYQRSEIDAGTVAATDEFDSMGITYAVNENMSVGYHASTYNAGDQAADQENTNFSLSYTMGSMTLSAAFVEEENRGGSTAAGDDVKGYEFDLGFAF
jgi:outer membrane protein OmpU